MSLLKTSTKKLAFTLILFVFSQHLSFADGGFPVRPGRLLISPSVSYFFANSQWDSTGTKKAFANNGRYSSIGVNLYAEYGLSRRFAVAVNLPFVASKFTQNVTPTTQNFSGLGDLETGLRYYLANIDFLYYISVQGTAITPLYHNDRALGYGEEGAELKFAVSGSGHLFGMPSYFNVSDGIRQYFGTNGPVQNRYNGTYGITLDEDFMNQLSIGVSGINSFSDDKRFDAAFLDNSKDFSFLQASLSYGHSFTREISLFASAGQFLTGRNTGIGTSFSLAFIYRLDYR